MNKTDTDKIEFSFFSGYISVSGLSAFLRNLQVALRAIGKENPETNYDFSGSNTPSLFICDMSSSDSFNIAIKFTYQDNDYDSDKSDVIFSHFLSKTFELCEDSAQQSLWGRDVTRKKTKSSKSSLNPESTETRLLEFVDHLKRMGDSEITFKTKKLKIKNKFASLEQ